MPVYRPSELKALLQQLGTAPKKGLSQNFMIDGNVVRKMAACAAVTAGDLIVEIGPGPGALTECLLDCGAHVVAIERDALFAAALRRLSDSSPGHLDVYSTDILTFPLDAELTRHLGGSGRRAKVVANLPYHLTSPILGLLLPRFHLIESVHIMVQDEVARRLTASPKTSNYSALTVFTQLYGTARYLFGVSRHCFMPAPEVDSAVVGITLQPPPSDLDATAFLAFVHCAFGQRRKTIKSALHPTWPRPQVLDALASRSLPIATRAEELPLSELIALYRLLSA